MLQESKYSHRGYRYSSVAVAAVIRRQDGMKRCSRCEITQPINQFHRDQSRSDGLFSYCFACCKVQRDQRRERRKTTDRIRYAKQKHQLTDEAP